MLLPRVTKKEQPRALLLVEIDISLYHIVKTMPVKSQKADNIVTF